MPRYRTLNNDLSFNADGRPIQADQDGTFNVATGSRAEAQLLAAGTELGAVGAVISGSGPTIAFLAANESAAVDLSVKLSSE